MSGCWAIRPIRSHLLLSATVTALTFGVLVPVQPASAAPVAQVGSPSVSSAAASPGHSPIPVFSAVYGVSCVRATYCLAVGGYNTNDVVHALTESWNGTAWRVLPTPGPSTASSSVLNAISCTSASQCIAVGSYTDSSEVNWALTESWNGSAWTLLDTPQPAGGTFVGLSGVSCTSASNCVAVGSYTNSGSTPVPLIEIWTGAAWSIVANRRPPGPASGLSAVSCVSRVALHGNRLRLRYRLRRSSAR